MSITKCLGICMDHATAHLMEFTTDPILSTTIGSKFTQEERGEGMAKSEHLMHNKERHDLSAYYKHLATEIRNFDEVLLFGPTDAKVELYNLLKADHNFATIKIEVANTDKMTEHQQHAFVKEHFSKKHIAF